MRESHEYIAGEDLKCGDLVTQNPRDNRVYVTKEGNVQRGPKLIFYNFLDLQTWFYSSPDPFGLLVKESAP